MVSVIVPVCNAQRTLGACLDSILTQSYGALEMLLVDDGSKDQSLAILRDYAQKDKRTRVFSQANNGVSAARNLALNHAIGQYVQFVDSDDVLLPHTTAHLVRAMESQGCDMAMARYIEQIHDLRQERGLFKIEYGSLPTLAAAKAVCSSQ